MMSSPEARPWRILLLVAPFIVYGFAELALIVWVGGQIGWWTLLLLGVTAAIGFFLLMREGRRAMDTLVNVTRTGHLPRGQMADTALVLIGAILLIVPGFISDVLGFSLVLPFTRPFLRSAISWWAAHALKRHNVTWTGTIEGEVVPNDVVDPQAPVIEGRIVESGLDDEEPRGRG